ncbi:hypothetical protein GALMADRAFT_265973 [Galerina marginata CBS 339.88]|uniref:Uncharacterized protein n=1 Tax=Galerina marginata (strain CBS 339.88) TaxID=685588 RepID=A0A067T901_GALM3|nr:hypothetical protein GALMADRAFT_265973 [Galerina marginata CBS 339.88]
MLSFTILTAILSAAFIAQGIALPQFGNSNSGNGADNIGNGVGSSDIGNGVAALWGRAPQFGNDNNGKTDIGNGGTDSGNGVGSSDSGDANVSARNREYDVKDGSREYIESDL